MGTRGSGSIEHLLSPSAGIAKLSWRGNMPRGARGMSLGYPAKTSIPDLVIGLDSGGGDDDAAVIAFGFAAASVVEDDDVEAVSLFAVALGGGVAFVCGDPAVKLEARLSVDDHFSSWENFFRRIFGDVYHTWDFIWFGLTL